MPDSAKHRSGSEIGVSRELGFVAAPSISTPVAWRRFLLGAQLITIAVLILFTAVVGWRLYTTIAELAQSERNSDLGRQQQVLSLVTGTANLVHVFHVVERDARTGTTSEHDLRVQDLIRRLGVELGRLDFAAAGPANVLVQRLFESHAQIESLFNQGLAEESLTSGLDYWRQAVEEALRFGQIAERLARTFAAESDQRMLRENELLRRAPGLLLGYLGLLLPALVLLTMMLLRWYRNESLLQGQRQLLDDAIEHMPGGFAVYDPQDRLQMCNEAFRTLYFRDCRDFVRVGRRFDELLDAFEQYTYSRRDHDERLRWLDQVVTSHREGGSYEEAVGNGRFVLATNLRLPDGRLLSTHTEITQLKHYEEELRRSQEQLQLVLGATRDGIWDWRLDLEQQEFSETWFRMIGYPQRPPRYEWRDGVHTDDLADVEAAIAAHCGGESDDYHASYRYRHVAGHYIWVEARGRCERDPAGRPLRFVGALSDISERRLMEQELALSRENLELAVRERTLQLENAIKELESISYTISHDLRSPLRAVDGFASILLEEYAGSIDGRGRDYLARLRRGSQQMGRLIDDLLALTRIFSQKFEPEQIDFTRLCHRVLNGLRESNPERPAEFVVQDSMRIIGDPTMILILVEKIVNNAWHFTAERDPARIRIDCFEDEDEVVYRVTDNGVGFDMAYYDQLFGAFRKLHTHSDFEGTGIGLATVARIIRRHKGRVWADSQPGKGATFYFTIGLKFSPVKRSLPN